MQKSSETSLASASLVTTIAAGARTDVALDIARGSISLSLQLRAAPAAGAMVLLFRGSVAADDQTQLARAFAEGGHVGTAPWPTAGQSPPTFDALLPGSYSACAALLDADVTCWPITVAASPARQSITLP